MNRSFFLNSTLVATASLLVLVCAPNVSLVAQETGPEIVPDPPVVELESSESDPALAKAAPNHSDQPQSILESTDEVHAPTKRALDSNGGSNLNGRSSSTIKKSESNPADIQAMNAGEKIDQLLTQLVLKNIPHDFTEDKDWNRQAERWDGLKVERDGLKIKTKRRKKKVNHGTWKKYSARLINPDEEFSISVQNMRQTKNGNMGFDIHFEAHLDVDGRQSKWVKGVQLYSLSAEGHAKIQLKVAMEMKVTMDVTQFPPDLIFKPQAKSADITVEDFRIDRVSKAGGEFAQQVTRGVRKKLDEKIREKKQKLVKKINKELDENSDKLRLAIADAVQSKWAGAAQEFLPDSVRQAIGSDGDK